MRMEECYCRVYGLELMVYGKQEQSWIRPLDLLLVLRIHGVYPEPVEGGLPLGRDYALASSPLPFESLRLNSAQDMRKLRTIPDRRASPQFRTDESPHP